MSTTTTYDIKTPAAILTEDVICQSFIQSSSTLAYSCLLIRSGRYDLAAHVLHSLEAKPASRFKDMVFYLQAQIGIETGDFSAVKKRLVPRVHQHPNDMVALSLLESCVFKEWEGWQQEHPAEAALAKALAEAHAHAPASDPMPALLRAAAPAVAAPASSPSPERTLIERPRAEEPAAAHEPMPLSLDALPAVAPAPPRAQSVAEPQAMPTIPIRRLEPAPVPSGEDSQAGDGATYTSSGGGDFGAYAGLSSNPQAFALGLWNSSTRKFRSAAKKEELKGLISVLPQILPYPLAAPVRALEGGDIQKVCFCFRDLTVTTLHSESENLGLLTGSLSQSLLTMVRADNLFQKQSAPPGTPRAGAQGSHGGSGPVSRESVLGVGFNE